MNRKQAEDILDDFLGRVSSTIGFRRVALLDYHRATNDAMGSLTFPCRVDPRGFTCFNCHVGVRFDAVQQWLKLASDKPTQLIPTMATPIHFLGHNRSFKEWKFSGLEDLESLRQPILKDLRDDALPFIERYSKLNEFRKVVESPNPPGWCILSADRRVILLAILQLIQGDKSGAIMTLDDALLQRQSAAPKDRFEIEYFRRRVLEYG
jgi:hypothetical protein